VLSSDKEVEQKIRQVCEIGKLKLGIIEKNFKIKFLTTRIHLLQNENKLLGNQIINFESTLGNFSKKSNILKESDILYFLHIPKTAGTALITILDNYFEPGSVLKPHDWHELLPQLPPDFSKYKFVRGHFGYSIVRNLPKKPICITMLRNPTDQVVSGLRMIRRQPRDAQKYSISENESLSDIVISGKIGSIQNPQTRWLLMDQDVIVRTRLMEKKELENYNPEEDQKMLPIHSETKYLQIAKRRIQEFAFVGLVEKMEKSLFLLHYTFGWKPIRNFIRKNAAPTIDKHEKLSEEALQKISDWTSLDIQLYNYAQELFESRYSQMVSSLEKKYHDEKYSKMDENEVIFDMLNKNYQETIKSKNFKSSS